MLRTSVNETTPLNVPERRAPAIADAGTVGTGTTEGMIGDGGATGTVPEALPVAGWEGCGGIAVVKPWGPIRGVAGAEGEGDADSTTHIRCERVATNFATVWANVEYGFT